MKSIVHFLASASVFLSTPVVVAYTGMELSVTPGTGSLSDTFRLSIECRTENECPRAETLSGMANFSIISESSLSNIVMQGGKTSILQKNAYQIVPKRAGTHVLSASGASVTVQVLTGSKSEKSTSEPKALPPVTQRDSTDFFDMPGFANGQREVGTRTPDSLRALWSEYPRTRSFLLFAVFLGIAYAFAFRRPKESKAAIITDGWFGGKPGKPAKTTNGERDFPRFPNEETSAEDCLAFVRQNLETRYNTDVSCKSFDELVALESDPQSAEMLGKLLAEYGRHAYSAAGADTTAIRILTTEYLKHVA